MKKVSIVQLIPANIIPERFLQESFGKTGGADKVPAFSVCSNFFMLNCSIRFVKWFGIRRLCSNRFQQLSARSGVSCQFNRSHQVRSDLTSLGQS